jgi:hypothetical protein
MLTKTEEYRVTIHEIGHWLIALHYKITSHIVIFSIDGGEHFDTNGTRSAGVCFAEKRGTPFQDSVWSWGGIMAELIAGVQLHPFDTGFPLATENLKYVHSTILSKSFQNLSLGDQLGICGKKPNDTLRSFKAAYKILSAEKSELLRLAELRTSRAGGYKATPSMPLPENWPATHLDFLRLICGNDEASFERFLITRAQCELVGGAADSFEAVKQSMLNNFLRGLTDEQRARHAGKTDSEIAEILFDENFAGLLKSQRRIFGSGFPDAVSWLAAARDFQNWVSAKNSTDQTP